eukprot:2102965-Amphidinium_carterae.1
MRQRPTCNCHEVPVGRMISLLTYEHFDAHQHVPTCFYTQTLCGMVPKVKSSELHQSKDCSSTLAKNWKA